MKIKRVVNGIEHEFELTGTELYKAYIEQEHIYDLADVEAYLDNKCPADQLEEIAYEARRQMDKYGVSLDFAIEEAVHICESRRNSVDFFKDFE
jgi:hypothetical protein